MMKDLIEALQIMLKYGNPHSPTHCSHDLLAICGIDPSVVSRKDIVRLEKLGFEVGDPWDCDDTMFYSHRYGSA